MYNSDRKERYLEYASQKYTPDYCVNIRSVFNMAENDEVVLDKDLADFSREDISNLYATHMYGDKYTYASINSRLSSYCQWCLENSLVRDGCNHFLEFTITDLERYVNVRINKNKYLTRKEFYELVKQLQNSRDQFILTCLFEFGKSDQFSDILTLKISDIDKEKGVAHLPSGKTVKVSKILIGYAEMANETYTYEMIPSGIPKPMDRESEYIFKKVASNRTTDDPASKVATKMMTRLMKSIVDIYGINSGINASAIAMSGLFEMVRDRSKELGLSYKDYVMTHFDEMQEQYNLSPNNSSSWFKKFGPYL